MRVLALLGWVSLLAACSSTTTPDRYRCTVRLGSALDRCIESTEVAATLVSSVTAACKTRGGTLEPVQVCATASRVGGCRKQDQGYSEIEWFYSTGTVTSARAAATACMGRTPLDPNGARIFSDDAGADVADGGLVGIDGGTTCSTMGGPAMTATFRNKTSEVVSAYFVDFQCAEKYYVTLAAGASLAQVTSGGHVWRFRLGDQIATGLLLKEYLADPLSPSVDVP